MPLNRTQRQPLPPIQHCPTVCRPVPFNRSSRRTCRQHISTGAGSGTGLTDRRTTAIYPTVDSGGPASRLTSIWALPTCALPRLPSATLIHQPTPTPGIRLTIRNIASAATVPIGQKTTPTSLFQVAHAGRANSWPPQLGHGPGMHPYLNPGVRAASPRADFDRAERRRRRPTGIVAFAKGGIVETVPNP